MYKPNLDPLVDKAKVMAWEERVKRYTPLWRGITVWCSQNDVLIGGVWGSQLMMGMPRDLTSVTTEIWCTDVFQKAKDLCDNLATLLTQLVDSANKSIDKSANKPEDTSTDKISGDIEDVALRLPTLHVSTGLVNVEVYVMYDLLPLVKFVRMDCVKNVSLYQMAGHSIVRHDGMDVKIMTPELFLVGLYRRLYNPANVGTCNDMLEWAGRMYIKLLDSEPKQRFLSLGGKRHDSSNRPDDMATIKMHELAKDFLIVGDYAIDAHLKYRSGGSKHKNRKNYGNKKYKNRDDQENWKDKKQKNREHNDRGDWKNKDKNYKKHKNHVNQTDTNPFARNMHKRLAFIVDRPLEELQPLVNAALPGAEIIAYKLQNVDDFQLVKYTVFWEKRPIADMYNCGNYEVLPRAGPERHDAHLFVVLRFLYVELWSLRFIARIVQSDYIMRRIVYIFECIKLLTKDIPAAIDLENLDLTFIRPEWYWGIWQSEAVMRKKFIAKKGRMAPYFPNI